MSDELREVYFPGGPVTALDLESLEITLTVKRAAVDPGLTVYGIRWEPILEAPDR